MNHLENKASCTELLNRRETRANLRLSPLRIGFARSWSFSLLRFTNLNLCPPNCAGCNRARGFL